MLFRAMGPLIVEDDGRELTFPSAKSRVVLTALLLRPNEPVTVDTLVDMVWPGEVPRTAAKTLQTYVMQLRRVLGVDRLVTDAIGYQIRLDDAELDVSMFTNTIQEARAAVAAGDLPRAVGCFESAVAWRRGRPFHELGDATTLAEMIRVEELWLTAHEELAAARLACGRHRDAISDLQPLVHVHPLREGLWEQLVVALHQDGRRAEALAAYDAACAHLVDAIGVEPGVALRRVHAAVLRDDELAVHALSPAVAYAPSARGLVAYQVVGGGPDLLVVPDWFNHLGLLWQHEAPRRFLEGLARASRVIVFDAIGIGLSDPSTEAPTLPVWVDSASAVLDAVDARDVVVLGSSAGAAVALSLAARQGDRIRALALYNPVGRSADTNVGRLGLEEVTRLFEEKWATGVAIPSVAPSRANDRVFNAWFGRFMSASASVHRVRELLRDFVFALDVLDDAAAVRCPVTIIQRRDNRLVELAGARTLAATIADCRTVELEGADHLWFLDDDGEVVDIVGALVQASSPPAVDRSRG